MEGNFRIVQLSSNEFVIEKEIVNIITYAWYEFKQPLIEKEWVRVDKRGGTAVAYDRLSYYSTYLAESLPEAEDKLEEIKKFPLIIKMTDGLHHTN